MEIEFKIDLNLFTQALHKINSELPKNLSKSAFRSAQKFITHLVKTWLTGRYADDVGLNRQTGTLARSWRAKVQSGDSEGLIASISTNVPYAKEHETGRREDGTKIKKRTFILDDWNKEGIIMFVADWNKVIEKELKTNAK